MIYLERAVFPCRIQYYLCDICTLMLPLCFQFPALTHNYLDCHLFKSPGKGKINLALLAFWSLEWEPICLKSRKLLSDISLHKYDGKFICQPDIRTNIRDIQHTIFPKSHGGSLIMALFSLFSTKKNVLFIHVIV